MIWTTIAALATLLAAQFGASPAAIQVCAPPAQQEAGEAMRDFVACLYYTPEVGDIVRRCPADIGLVSTQYGGLYHYSTHRIQVAGVSVEVMLHEEAHCYFDARGGSWAWLLYAHREEYASPALLSALQDTPNGWYWTASELFAATISDTHCKVTHPLFAGVCRTSDLQVADDQFVAPF